MKIIITKGDPNDPLVKAFAEPFSLESEIECCKLEAVEELLQFVKREGINRNELAERMGVPPSRITRLLNGSENLTISTLVRAGRAVGGELKIRFQPAKTRAEKPKASETSISKVAEEPTPCRAKRKPVKPLDDPDFIGAEAALQRASAKAIAKARAAGLEPIVCNPADLPKQP